MVSAMAIESISLITLYSIYTISLLLFFHDKITFRYTYGRLRLLSENTATVLEVASSVFFLIQITHANPVYFI